MSTLHVSSQVSHRSREGRVQFYMEPPKDAWTMSVEEAKHHALAVIEAMNAAVTDAFLVAWLQDEMKLDRRHAPEVPGVLADSRHGFVEMPKGEESDDTRRDTSGVGAADAAAAR